MNMADDREEKPEQPTEGHHRQWLAQHSEAVGFEKHLRDKFKSMAPGGAVIWDGCVDTFVVLSQARDDIREFVGYENQEFRWKKVIRKEELIADATGLQSPMFNKKKKKLEIEEWEEELVLELSAMKNNKEQWMEWVKVKESNVKNAGLGVFACRRFQRNHPIGIYVGTTVGNVGGVGEEHVTDDRTNGISAATAKYSLSCWDRKARPVVLAGQAFGSRGFHPYMGMHLMNNFAMSYRVGTKQHKEAKSRQNCTVEADGVVYAARQINNLDELYLPYYDYDTKEVAEEAPKRKRKQAGKARV